MTTAYCERGNYPSVDQKKNNVFKYTRETLSKKYRKKKESVLNVIFSPGSFVYRTRGKEENQLKRIKL